MEKFNYLLVLFLLLISCSNSEQVEKQKLKDILLGEWIEISPCESCNTLIFSPNDTIYLKNQSDTRVYRMHYQIISNDSIEVTRIWDIEENKKTTNHKAIFLTNEILLLNQFMPVDYGITGFEDIKLTKSN